jgi:probable HAF family extracellular repeat protein
MVEVSASQRRVARIAVAVSLGIVAVTASGAAPAWSRPAHGSHCRPPAGYSNVDIGALGTGFTAGVDLNNRGVVVGGSETPEGTHAFVWRRGRMTDITPAGGTGGVAGVNDRGEVVHSWYDPVAGDYRTAIWRNGRSTVILRGYDEVRGLNERGEVLFFYAGLWHGGTFEPIQGDVEGTLIPQKLSHRGHVIGTILPPTPPGGGHPSPWTGFVWHDGALTPAFPPQGAAFRTVVDVDRSGRVLFEISSGWSSALWHDGHTTDLGTLGGSWVGPADLNEHGRIVGSSMTASGDTHAFLWEDGTITDLHPVEGLTSWANKINERGEAAGAVGDFGSSAATVWACGRAIPLDIAGAFASIATDINDRGQVLSIAQTPQGTRAILSTPTRR